MATNDRNISIHQDVVLALISDPHLIERRKHHSFHGEYSKDGYQEIRTPINIQNETFKRLGMDFKLSFDIIHHVRINTRAGEACEAALLNIGPHKFDIKLTDDSSLINGFSLEESEGFIRKMIYLTERDHYKALQAALTLYFAKLVR